MKDQILDDIFKKDKLLELLDEDENLLWEGRPLFETKSYFKILTAMPIIICVGQLITTVKENHFWATTFWICVFIGTIIMIILKKNKTRYLITNQRIIFQLQNGFRRKIHSLPLNRLKDFEIKKDGELSGVIFLKLMPQYKPNFKTHNIKNNNARNHLTLELVENPEEVLAIIEAARKGTL